MLTEDDGPALDKDGLVARLRVQVEIRDSALSEGDDWGMHQHRTNQARAAIRVLVAACLLLRVEASELTEIIIDEAVVTLARDCDLRDSSGWVYGVAHALYDHALTVS